MIHSSNSETAAIGIVCPVCRAKQAAQRECRRCGADNSLYVKALQSVLVSRRQLALAADRGDTNRTRELLDYLQWLAPNETGLNLSIPADST